MNLKDIELIENYLLERLSQKDREAIEIRLKEDKLFLELFQEQKIIQDGATFNALKVAQESLQTLESTLADSTLSDPKTRKKAIFGKKMFWSIAACAGAIILGAIIIFNTKPTSNQAIFEAYFEPYENINPKKRSESPDIEENVINTAFDNYDAENYIQAIALFKQIVEKETNPDYLFYLGNAQLANGNARESIKTFKAYLQLSNDFESQATWYIILAHLQLNEVAKSCDMLSNKNTFDQTYLKKANKLSTSICN